MKGIAFDIVFQNTDPDEALFAETLKKYKNVVIASSYTRSTTCQKDTNGRYETCDGVPRSVYKDAIWGMVNLSSTGDRRVMRYDISDIAYASWRSSSVVDTLALALYTSTQDAATKHFTPGQMYLTPFFGGPNSYASIDFTDILTMPLGALIQNFSGKYVFIGESGTMIHDAHISPVSGTSMDGVESHAHLLDGLLQGRIPHEMQK